MAKKRKSSIRRKRTGKTIGESSWKKSPLLAGILGVAIALIWYSTFFRADSNRLPEQKQMDNLPKFYMTEKSRKIRKIPGKRRPVPFYFDAADKKAKRKTWLAYVCMNEDCPGREEKDNFKPYIFPHIIKGLEVGKDGKPKYPQEDPNNPEAGMAAWSMMDQPPMCPKCGEYTGLEGVGVQEYRDKATQKEYARLTKAIHKHWEEKSAKRDGGGRRPGF